MTSRLAQLQPIPPAQAYQEQSFDFACFPSPVYSDVASPNNWNNSATAEYQQQPQVVTSLKRGEVSKHVELSPETLREMDSVMDAFLGEIGPKNTEKTFGGLLRDHLMTSQDYVVDAGSEKFRESTRNRRWMGSSHQCGPNCQGQTVSQIGDATNNPLYKMKLLRRRIKRMKEKKMSLQSPPIIKPNKKRAKDRSKRNEMGLLVSSLERKIYHCMCLDCKSKRKCEGVHEPLEPIEIHHIHITPQNLSQPEQTGVRGRPRMYPRIKDLNGNPETGLGLPKFENRKVNRRSSYHGRISNHHEPVASVDHEPDSPLTKSKVTATHGTNWLPSQA